MQSYLTPTISSLVRGEISPKDTVIIFGWAATGYRCVCVYVCDVCVYGVYVYGVCEYTYAHTTHSYTHAHAHIGMYMSGNSH